MTAVERPAPPPVRTHKAHRTWVGKSIRKVEDPKFLRGRGGYIAWEGEKEGEFAFATPLHVTGVEDAPRHRRKRAA